MFSRRMFQAAQLCTPNRHLSFSKLLGPSSRPFFSQVRKVCFPYGFLFFLVCAPTVVSLNLSFDRFWSFSRPWLQRTNLACICQFHLFLCSRVSVIIVYLSHVLACAIKFQIWILFRNSRLPTFVDFDHFFRWLVVSRCHLSSICPLQFTSAPSCCRVTVLLGHWRGSAINF